MWRTWLMRPKTICRPRGWHHPANPSAIIVNINGSPEPTSSPWSTASRTAAEIEPVAALDGEGADFDRPHHDIRASVADVQFTLVLTICLVVGVILSSSDVAATLSPPSPFRFHSSDMRRDVHVRLQHQQPHAHAATISTASWSMMPS